jgi:hypothetical protein
MKRAVTTDADATYGCAGSWSQTMSNKSADEDPIETFRKAFITARRTLIAGHGPEAFDLGHSLYICPETSQSMVVSDSFLHREGCGPVEAFVQNIEETWWKKRSRNPPETEGKVLEPICGLYGHFLPGSGFDWIVEFQEGGTHTRFWRVGADGRETELISPEHEGIFRDQMGGFFDLRSGWRWICESHLSTGEFLIREVEPGYLMGARPGVPGDPNPSGREDPELVHAFSRWDTQDYDVLEFLGSHEAESYPFHGERCIEWLGERGPLVTGGQIDLFILGDSRCFFGAVRELCDQRQVEATWPQEEPDGRLFLSRDDVRAELHFAYVFLRTLHTGRTFAEGARAFVQPTLNLVEEASDLCRNLKEKLPHYEIRVVDGMTLEVREPGEQTPIGCWSMVNLVGRSNLRGSGGLETALKLLGFNAESGRIEPRTPSLDACPICDQNAYVGKSIRPLAQMGSDPRTLAGVVTRDHVIYFTINCLEHSTPVLLDPELSLAQLEEAYRSRLDETNFAPLFHDHLDSDDEVSLVIGFDAGSLILEPGRVKAVLEALGQPSGGDRQLYGLFPDALLIANDELDGTTLNRARLAAREVIEQLFSGRAWPLDVNRAVNLDGPAQGKVDWSG